MFRSPLVASLALGLFVVGSLIGLAVADDWPQWRGPNCTGISSETAALPVEFSAEKNCAWSVPLGDGISSPVVVAGRVFSTAIEGERPGDRFVVYCHDAANGEELWRRVMEITGQPLAAVHESNSYASSTPAADAERVFVYFTRFGLMALDAATGETKWHAALPEPYFVFDWGPGMSPVVDGDRVFFCQDDDLFPALYCFDAASGDLVWKDDRSDMACCYSHPVVCQTDAGRELVVAGTGMLLGYDYDTGERRWASELFCRNIKTTPVSLDGVLYLSFESKGISYQWRVVADADGDGKITRAEIETNKYRLNADRPIPDEFWKKFERGDENGDGVLEGAEIDKAFLDPSNQGGLLAGDVQARLGDTVDVQAPTEDITESQSASFVEAVRGGGRGDVSASHVLWRHESKAPDHVVSPLVVDGRMHVIKSGGISSCFDTSDGESVWGRRRFGNSSQHLGSPVYGDGKIYVPGENGTIVVLANGPELNVLAKNELGETSASTPAIADGRLYIRTRDHLYCFAVEPE
ncbi:MAG: PQQ-binding-like beta-propeller repeat protein [Pirellulales bacterium]